MLWTKRTTCPPHRRARSVSVNVPASRALLWLLSLSALAWCALSWHSGLPAPSSLALAFVALFSLATFGVLWPQCNMYGRTFHRGRADSREIALTFDDGPHPTTTREILRVLREEGALGTFFLVGHKVQAHPDVVQEIHAAGHAIGIHGFDHDRLFCLRSAKYVQEQIERAERAIEAACGVTPTLFRPPVGFASHLTFLGAERAQVEVVIWTVRSFDGVKRTTAAQIIRRVVSRLRGGGIVLLHDAAERDDFAPQAAQALPTILRAMRAAGFRAVRLDQMAR